MKKIFTAWLFLWAVFFTSNATAQISIGTVNGRAKAPEKFAALEIVSDGKGGLRLPQLTTDQRNALALASVTDATKKTLTSGLTILNTTTNCVEYWNANRWISLCEGTSQTSISPAACADIKADGTGCDQTFTIKDPDCPNGPYKIAIIAGGDAATLTNVDEANGSFKIYFNSNESITSRSVLVRVTSTCTNQYKDFVYMQSGVICSELGAAPVVSPSASALSLCSGGAVYLWVPSSSSNLDKLIWTRNGIEVARGVSYYVATLKGVYNVSLGAAGCNVSSSNERVITESATAAPVSFNTLVAANNGVICGSSGSITLNLPGATGIISWFKNGVLQSGKFGNTITVAAADAGEWFAAAGNGGCYSRPSNTVNITVNAASSSISVPAGDVLVNNKPISSLTSFCAGGSLTLKINNPQSGISYTWYNGQTVITSPYIVPGQSTMKLRMVASDNSGSKCPAEASTTDLTVTTGGTPGVPTISGSGVICDGSATLSIIPAETGSYIYQWYKNGDLMWENGQTITATEPGTVYSATVSTASGCTSPYATKTISSEVSSLPILTWVSGADTANFGDKLTYQVAAEHGPVTYSWTVDAGATTVGSGSSATVSFPSSGTEVHVKVKATNGCGSSAELDKVVRLASACPTPVVAAASATALNTTVGIGVTAQVSVTSANTTTYQWYTNTTAAASGGSAISGATSASVVYTPTATGTVYLYCIVKNGCTGTPQSASTPVFTVTTATNPASLTLGAGTFAGKTCFDINKSNDGGDCGTKASRAATATNFATQFAQPYVFTASATGVKSNLRFVIVDPLGAVESSNAATAGVSGSISNNQAITLTVNYKKTLSDVTDMIYGKTTAQAVKVQIYAVYNDGSKDVAVPLNVNLQDCACCGAFIAPGVWKNFMCHNLGADTSADPNKPSMAISGAYYQWGRKDIARTAPQNGDKNLAYFSETANIPKDNALSDTFKTENDPCPAGYRLPTADQWDGVSRNNKGISIGTSFVSSLTNFSSAVKVGDNLVLPLAGSYSAHLAGLSTRGSQGRYLGSTPYNSIYQFILMITSYVGQPGASVTAAPNHKNDGFSVRCISEN